MRYYMVAVLAIFAVGCTKSPNKIDPEFKQMYQEFIDEANAHGLDLPYDQGMTIEIGTLGQEDSQGELIGECSPIGYGDGNILIDKNFWYDANDAERHVLLFHELGHCVLGRKHNNNHMSIMYPMVNVPAEYYDVDKSEMLEELFKNEGQ